MRYPILSLIAASAAVLVPGSATFAQNPWGTTETVEEGASIFPPYDPRDIAGFWSRGSTIGGLGRCETSQGPCGNRYYNDEIWPVFTPEGQARFDSYRPSYGMPKDSEEAKANPQLHIGYRRAVQPALGNDPQGTCNPLGSSRLVLFNQQSEIIVLPGRIIQHVDQTNAWRTWWMDGRELPAPEEVDIPRWHGYSVAHWEGNTLVVETVGQDDRVWVDMAGFPLSWQAHLEERYTRTAYDALELKMTLTDPLFYEEPWVSTTKRFITIGKHYLRNSNWAGLYEEDCAPADEIFEFRRNIVIPSAEGAEVPY